LQAVNDLPKFKSRYAAEQLSSFYLSLLVLLRALRFFVVVKEFFAAFLAQSQLGGTVPRA
jgi:hypothetical protein